MEEGIRCTYRRPKMTFLHTLKLTKNNATIFHTTTNYVYILSYHNSNVDLNTTPQKTQKDLCKITQKNQIGTDIEIIFYNKKKERIYADWSSSLTQQLTQVFANSLANEELIPIDVVERVTDKNLFIEKFIEEMGNDVYLIENDAKLF